MHAHKEASDLRAYQLCNAPIWMQQRVRFPWMKKRPNQTKPKEGEKSNINKNKYYNFFVNWCQRWFSKSHSKWLFRASVQVLTNWLIIVATDITAHNYIPCMSCERAAKPHSWGGHNKISSTQKSSNTICMSSMMQQPVQCHSLFNYWQFNYVYLPQRIV